MEYNTIMSDNETRKSGVSFLGLLTILLIGLKLTGFVNWSWFWVLSPLVFQVVIFVIAALIIVFFDN